MGQKVNPVGIRLGIIKDWCSTWFANSKNYAATLHDDIKVRDYIYKKLSQASVSRIQIERLAQNVKIIIYSARPGVIIGKTGKDVDQLRADIGRMLKLSVFITITEVRKPELEAKLVAESIAQQLEKRVMFRRAMKRAVQTTMRSGAKGIKVAVAGRLGGAEIARTEWYREGRVPLHTFRADIDYALARANTTYGVIGVKVWVYKGEVLSNKQPVADDNATAVG